MKKLTERYGRYHARFTLDDAYLALPRAIRNDAYLYLLALAGHRRAEEADECVPEGVAEALAGTMGLSAEKMLNALAGVTRDGQPRILERRAGLVVLLKQSKWQDMPEEIAELKAKRSEAGRLGGLISGRARQATDIEDAREASAPAPAQASASASALASAKAKAGQIVKQNEAEIEIERELYNPPDPPLGGLLSSTAIEIIRWWCQKRGWQAVPPSKQREVYRDASALATVGLEEAELLRLLEELYEAAAEKPYSLRYFWIAAQERLHELVKVQTPLRSISEFVQVRSLSSPPNPPAPQPPKEVSA